jgi:hypothetical protein
MLIGTRPPPSPPPLNRRLIVADREKLLELAEPLAAATTTKDLEHLAIVFEKTGGKAWEPPSPQFPWIERMVAAGFLRRCDMRCGFEAFKATGLTFTDAGRIVLAALRARAAAQEGR